MPLLTCELVAHSGFAVSLHPKEQGAGCVVSTSPPRWPPANRLTSTLQSTQAYITPTCRTVRRLLTHRAVQTAPRFINYTLFTRFFSPTTLTTSLISENKQTRNSLRNVLIFLMALNPIKPPQST